MDDFVAFPKIPRLKRECFITEKLDGTNAQIVIKDGVIRAGSRNQWVTPEKDNYGFAGWVERNKEELLTLGDGQHFGEWYGNGIQRNYGLQEKKFVLFNTSRFEHPNSRPSCCGVVPILHRGVFSTEVIDSTLQSLRDNGSVAVPGFMNPEGIIVYLVAARQMFKVLLENDELPKGLAV